MSSKQTRQKNKPGAKSLAIRRFARYYGYTVAEATVLFESYKAKPTGYKPVLGVDNAKTSLGESLGYLTGIIYFAPSNSSGYKVCFFDALCRDLCLGPNSGHGQFTKTQQARIRKTKRYFEQHGHFMLCLYHDVLKLMIRAMKLKMTPAVRPNGTSDLPHMAHAVAKTFTKLQVYDYTKNPKPHQKLLPNYHITFSRSGMNDSECHEAMANGVNFSVVFSGKTLPTEYMGYPVLDGTTHDLRFLDAPKHIVGLLAKGPKPKKNTDNAFIVLQ